MEGVFCSSDLLTKEVTEPGIEHCQQKHGWWIGGVEAGLGLDVKGFVLTKDKSNHHVMNVYGVIVVFLLVSLGFFAQKTIDGKEL